MYTIHLGKTGLFIIVSIVVFTIFIDTSITRIYAFTGGLTSHTFNILVFSGVTIVYLIGQHFILTADVLKKAQIKNPLISFVYRIVTIVQYGLVVILFMVIAQMFWTTSYNLYFFKTVVWINYGIAMFLLGLLAVQFFSWYKSKKNYVVMTYGIAMLALSLNALFAVLYVSTELSGQRGIDNVSPIRSPVSIVNTSDNMLNLTHFWASLLSFVLIWLATVLLMRHYTKKLGVIKYWIAMSIPLIYFLSQFQYELLIFFNEFRASSPILFGIAYTLIFSAAKLIRRDSIWHCILDCLKKYQR